MKDIDLNILKALRINARESLTTISKKTGIPLSTVFLKIKENEISVIKKHTSLIDYACLGYNHWQKIVIKANSRDKEEIEKYLINHKNVNSVYEINGGYDYLIETVHKNIKDYFMFIKELESKFGIIKKQEFQIISDIKREEFMAEE